jgi:AcrR family transcriptional regulator
MQRRAIPVADTRERILAHAGPLFATHGLEGLGIRQLARAARVNLAAVNYHFGSKHALFREVCLRHLRAIDALRSAELDALEARPARPTAERILEAHLRPLVAFARSGDPTNLLFLRLVMAQVARRDPRLVEVLAREGMAVRERTLALLAKALPGAAADDLRTGMIQVIGAATHLLMTEGAARRRPSAATTLRRLVAHGAAGLRAA